MTVAGLVARMEGMPEQLRGAGPLTCLPEHRSLSVFRRGGWRACAISCNYSQISYSCNYCNCFWISAALNSGLKGQTLVHEARCCVAKIALYCRQLKGCEGACAGACSGVYLAIGLDFGLLLMS